jgi:GNAT superfamily N-acetyltransferase
VTSDASTFKRLAAALPDIPRFVEVRSMLLTGTCEVEGLEDSTAPSFVAFSPYTRGAAVVGLPSLDAIQTLAGRIPAEGDLVAFEDNLGHVTAILNGWEVEPAVIHLLADSSRLPALEPIGAGAPIARPYVAPHAIPVPSDGADDDITMRMVSGDEIGGVEGIDEELRVELMAAALVGAVGATFVNGKAVSFCTAQSETETLWDIGIDTLEPHRERGYATLCVSYMIDQLGRRGKRPVWGAEESNEPSMRLAAKLGFRPVDRLYVLSRPS